MAAPMFAGDPYADVAVARAPCVCGVLATIGRESCIGQEQGAYQPKLTLRYPRVPPKTRGVFRPWFRYRYFGRLGFSFPESCLCVVKRRKQRRSIQHDEFYTKKAMRNDFKDCVRFNENEQTAREVYEKSCFGRKWPQTAKTTLRRPYWSAFLLRKMRANELIEV